MRARGVLVVMLAVACGGGGLGAGGPLRHTLPEKHLVTVPQEEKDIYLGTKQELDQAVVERDRLEARQATAKAQAESARSGEREAKTALSAAKSQAKAASGGADRARQNDAARLERVAELRLRNARAKRAFHEAVRSWVDAGARWARANVYAREARYELDKAKVASSRNIRPSGFALAAFDTQHAERRRRATDLREAVDDARRKAEDRRAEWIIHETELQKTLGKTGAPEATAAALDAAGAGSATPR